MFFLRHINAHGVEEAKVLAVSVIGTQNDYLHMAMY